MSLCVWWSLVIQSWGQFVLINLLPFSGEFWASGAVFSIFSTFEGVSTIGKPLPLKKTYYNNKTSLQM